MKWDEIKGDLIELSKEGKFDLIIHGCNCKKNMGAGIAKTIKQVYPSAYQIDVNYPNAVLGDYSVCNDYDECIIINAYTQIYPGKPKNNSSDNRENRYKAIRSVMKKINERFEGKHIGLPLIGCGLAGLDWKDVRNILRHTLHDVDVTIVHFNK